MSFSQGREGLNGPPALPLSVYQGNEMSVPMLEYLAIASYVMPLPAGMLKYRMLSREMKILFYFLIIGLVTDVLSLWQYLGPRSAHWLVHVYIIIEFVLLMVLISFWQESRRVNRIILLLTGFYAGFWILAKCTFEPFNGIYYLSGSISAVLLTLCAGYTLFIVIEQRSQPLFRYDRFWVLLSLVINYTGSLLPIVFAGIVFAHSREYLFRLWSITWIATILSHLLFMVGFLCQKTRTP
jgi:hypothetical protein